MGLGDGVAGAWSLGLRHPDGREGEWRDLLFVEHMTRSLHSASRSLSRAKSRGSASVGMTDGYGLSPRISLGRSPTSPMVWRTKKRRRGGTRLAAAKAMLPISRTGFVAVGNQRVPRAGGGALG